MSKRRISSVPVIFKGSGWYVTDYSRKNSTLSDDVPKEATATAKDSKESKEEKKPKEASKPKEESKASSTKE
jgi:hypothetical protein